jgi:enoyl-CoA hydratase
MEYRCFEVDVQNKIAHVHMARPEVRNTMIPEFWRELPEIVTRLSDDGGVRVMVLSAAGRHFTAGMDLSSFDAGDEHQAIEAGRLNAGRTMTIRRMQESFSALERARTPVLAAVQGGCVGGGVDLVTACDARYATADAFFVVQETKLGITADLGTLQRLPKLVPEGVARELVYTGRRLPAGRAYEIGLVNEVFDDHDALLAAVEEVAAEIATQSPLAVWGSKEMLVHARDHPVYQGLDRVAMWNGGAFQAADLGESLKARSQGRATRYDDLAPVQDEL